MEGDLAVCPTCGCAAPGARDKDSHLLYGRWLSFLDFEQILFSLGASGSDVERLWPEGTLAEVFPTEIAISGENGGGGNRTRVTCPAENGLSSENAFCSADEADPRPPVAEATPGEQRVLDSLTRLAWVGDGWPVSVREICADAGYASTSTVHMHLQSLERKGLVERHRRCGFRPAVSRTVESEAVSATRETGR